MILYYWDMAYATEVWQYINSYLGNPYGAAGLMGNLYAESGICPFRQQYKDYEQSWDLTINNFRRGDKNNFVYYDGDTGYSLAQWTTYSRRANYWDYIGGSEYIGDGNKSLQFLMHELETGYPGVYNTLVTAASIEEASDIVLSQYEIPENWQDKKETRRAYSRQVYDDFSGTPPLPGRKLPKWIIIKLIKGS